MTRWLITLITLSCFWLSGGETVLAAKNTPAPQATKKQKKKALPKLSKRALRQSLRRELKRHCQATSKHPKPLADLRGQLTFSQREERILYLQMHLQKLRGYLSTLIQAQTRLRSDSKMMRMGYTVSNGLMTVGSFIMGKVSSKGAWFAVLLPFSVKAASTALSPEVKLATPQPLTLNIDKEYDQIIQRIHHKKHHGIYANIICYLSAKTLKNSENKRCRPDHPYVIRQHHTLGKLWARNHKKLKKASYSKWVAPALEFITKHELKVVNTNKDYAHLMAQLIQTQVAFLHKVIATLKHDQKAHDCPMVHLMMRKRIAEKNALQL